MSMREIVSIMGGGLIHPIVYLIESLDIFISKKHENGSSVSIALLCSALVESAVNRLIYDCGLANCWKTTKEPRKFFKKYIDDNILQNDIYIDYIEIMSIRDAIIHNHIWMIMLNSESEPETYELHDGYGDKHFRNSIDIKTGKTKKNGINTIPTMIARIDAIKIFKITYNLLEKIEEIQKSKMLPCIKVSLEYVRYKGNNMSLPEILKNL